MKNVQRRAHTTGSNRAAHRSRGRASTHGNQATKPGFRHRMTPAAQQRLASSPAVIAALFRAGPAVPPAARSYPAGQQPQPMSPESRETGYTRQNKGRPLTPAQRRRIARKSGRPERARPATSTTPRPAPAPPDAPVAMPASVIVNKGAGVNWAAKVKIRGPLGVAGRRTGHRGRG